VLVRLTAGGEAPMLTLEASSDEAIEAPAVELPTDLITVLDEAA
jgi:hypothetical protein